MTEPATPHRVQTGAALVISLVVLLIMTLFGVSAMRSTALEERMASNAREQERAFEAAESALRGGELYIEQTLAGTAADLEQRMDNEIWLYSGADAEPDPANSVLWTESAIGSAQHAELGTADHLANSPRFYLRHLGTEELGALNLGGYERARGTIVHRFGITARGTGGRDSIQTVLRSHYGRLFSE